MAPTTRYAKAGDLHIAYQVVGDGPIDLVYVSNGYYSHVDHVWEDPSTARCLERLASFSRLILFDRRGAGLSDPVPGAATLEDRMEDVLIVMDAAGSDHAAVLAVSEAATMACLFAATHPDRTAALILLNSWATTARDPDRGPRNFEWLSPLWGTGDSVGAIVPTRADDPRFRDWWARWERLSASPGAVAAQFRAAWATDVRPVLPTIHAPTLVLHSAEDSRVSPEHGRRIADAIPGARFVEVPGVNHYAWAADTDTPLDEIEEMLTGVRRGPQADSLLATVLFTDIVDSTSHAARLGDRRWRSLIEDHDELVRRQLVRFRGIERHHTGDGFFATFDGPARGIRCAQSVIDASRGLGLEVRTGVHTGECERVGEDVRGLAVHIGARVAAAAGPGEVLVSTTVKDLVMGSGIDFADRGVHSLKGVPGEWRLHAALPSTPAALVDR
ncbi:MAG TPA: alpha/beta fold hydrolase [Solirubrobacteraceae bacterium]|nr:alpha/beta fold hydrolase [Solirubrobacteraceae bacterium]